MCRKKRLAIAILCLAAGVAYYFVIKVFGISIPCMFYKLSGGRLKCPGCGITTMFMNILSGDFSGAFKANPCIFLMLPIWAVIIVIRIIFAPKWLDDNSRFFNFFIYFSIVILVIFGVVRNIISLI